MRRVDIGQRHGGRHCDEAERDVFATSLAPIEQAIADSAALPGKENDEEQHAAENLLRLKADRDRVEQVRALGFTGLQLR
ncbi:hypothetical protein [Amycolatopsis sp. NPDC051903]|uniref:hypothetical protein n=1 Tax=Amycolatopsis sp. NPDC051903 TaxID=3363936 RepID=UPI0037ABAA19